MKTIGIIPARFASVRFPGKPLVDMLGKSMIQRVYEQAQKAELLDEAWVATDDQRIFDAVKNFGGNVILTSADHPSGTDRCAGALKQLFQKGYHFDQVLNIQGDEPFIDPSVIDQLIEILKSDESVEIATLVRRINEEESIFNANVVKAVFDQSNWALYFSRHPIPFQRNLQKSDWAVNSAYYQHIGLYGFKSETLFQIAQLEPTSLEKAESLEQLRWLENGLKIKIGQTTLPAFGIDTPEDLERAIQFLQKTHKNELEK